MQAGYGKMRLPQQAQPPTASHYDAGAAGGPAVLPLPLPLPLTLPSPLLPSLLPPLALPLPTPVHTIWLLTPSSPSGRPTGASRGIPALLGSPLWSQKQNWPSSASSPPAPPARLASSTSSRSRLRFISGTRMWSMRACLAARYPALYFWACTCGGGARQRSAWHSRGVFEG